MSDLKVSVKITEQDIEAMQKSINNIKLPITRTNIGYNDERFYDGNGSGTEISFVVSFLPEIFDIVDEYYGDTLCKGKKAELATQLTTDEWIGVEISYTITGRSNDGEGTALDSLDSINSMEESDNMNATRFVSAGFDPDTGKRVKKVEAETA